MENWRKIFLAAIAVLLLSSLSYSSTREGADPGADEARAESPTTAEARPAEGKDICSYCHPSGQAIDSTGDSFSNYHDADSRGSSVPDAASDAPAEPAEEFPPPVWNRG